MIQIFRFSLCSIISVLLIINTRCANKEKIDTNLPWSQRMAKTILQDHPDIWSTEERTEPKWNYTYGLLSLSFLELYEKTGEQKYYDYVKKYCDELIDEKGIIKTYKKTDYNIDMINSGKILFLLYEKTSDQRYKIAIDSLREQLREHPQTEIGGFWHKKKYPHQMWLDGLYMGAPFYAQYGQVYNEPENFDAVAHWIITMEKVARDPETGLLYHGWDESKQQQWADPETGLSSNFWGRGIGWYSMALVDVLDYIPEDHPYAESIIAIINRLSEAIIKVQHPDKRVWYQVVDQGDREGNYLEGSVSAMFTYFLLKSIKKGYINESYLENAKAAYKGIIENLIKVKKDGRVVITPVCAVAGLGGEPYRDGSYEYYINEKRRDNDPKAVAPFIMASILYEEMIK